MKYNIIKYSLLSAVLLASITSRAVDLTLAWGPSSGSNITNYTIYCSTNNVNTFNLTNYTTKVNVGTNLVATLEDIKPATWSFAATAQNNNGIESDFSNIVIVEIPAPPTATHTIIMQQSINLTNWTDFFRLKITTP